MTLIVVCDGGYRKVGKKPGVATYAWLAHRGIHLVRQESGIVSRSRAANNLMAEYAAVVAALRWVRQTGLLSQESLIIRTDCRFVADRLNALVRGRRVRGTVMLQRAAVAHLAALRRKGYRVTVDHVDRKLVAPAHTLCRQMYRKRPPPGHHPCLRSFFRVRRGVTDKRASHK